MVWLRRIGHFGGFGIQSPTDYRFVRYVINESWPYYAYDEISDEPDWIKRKLGRLYFRIANEIQPYEVIDKVGVMNYVRAGCKKAKLVDDVDSVNEVQLAIVPISFGYDTLLNRCGEQSVVIFHDIYKQMLLWHQIEHDPRVQISYDLYYCGIVFFDKKQSHHNYIVNF